MPIRHCQKCGLKVLIDESQAGANPFYCQRCTTAMKSSDQPDPIVSGNTPVKKDVPQAVSAAAAPMPSSSAGSSMAGPSKATVKVLCPYCKASFNGRVPQKPARGACPVCQKELILLPTGDIRASQGFDVGKWQQEMKDAPPAGEPEPEPASVGGPPTPPEKQTGTRLLIKKYAAETEPAPAPAAAKADPGTRILSRKQAESTPVPVSEPAAELPDWLDDKKPSRPTTDELVRSKELQRDPARTEADEEMPAEQLPIEELPPEPIKPRIVIRPAAARPAAAPPPLPEPEPEPPPEPVPAARPALGARKPGTVRRPEPAAPVASAPTGGGKVFVAWAILILPLIACPVLLNSREKFKGTPVEKVGGMFRKGFFELNKKLFPPPPPPKEKKVELPPEPPPPPPEPPPKPDPNQQDKDEKAIAHMNDEILRLKRDERQARVAATPEQQKTLDELRVKIKEKQSLYEEKRDSYRKIYGKDFDPNK